MRELTCHCDQTFSVDLPETVNLDERPEVIDAIDDGSFLSCVCPSCNAQLNTDLRTEVLWPSKHARLLLIPEADRMLFFSGKLEIPEGTQVVIGYPELADRIAALKAGLDVTAVETLKYHLAEQAEQTNPGKSVRIYFESANDSEALEFHIHGLRDDEVAVTKIPMKLYHSIRQSISNNPDDDVSKAVCNGSYISWQNILIEDNGND
ncbi:MAG: hypothetical protein JXP39_10760 [Spirochaetales bacterium]|nr:hypothetical protein [Spirochaetales bacterium]